MFSVKFHAKRIKYVGLATAVVERGPVHHFHPLTCGQCTISPVDGSNAPLYVYTAYKLFIEEEEVKQGSGSEAGVSFCVFSK